MTNSQLPSPPSQRSVLRYLEARGWRSQQSRDGRLVKTFLPGESGEPDVELVFTTSLTGEAQRREVEAAVRTISQLYGLQFEAATLAVSALPYDLILSRIPDEYVRNNSIELRLASNYIQSMRSFLAASATTEIVRQTFFKRTRKEALEYAGRCRFAHTFKGSFGFVVESPVGLNDTPHLLGVAESAPFERKVLERVVRGLKTYRQAVAQEDVAPMVAQESGFSANMCDEVVGLIEDTEISKLDLSIQFSPEWKTELGRDTPTTFSIERRYVDLLKDAAAKLRKEETFKEETIVGRVVRLEAEGNPSDLLEDSSQREVVISWDSPEYGLIKVQTPLTPEGYLDAVEAHKNGLFVSTTGLLRRHGRSWSLDGPVSLQVLRLIAAST